MKAVVLEIKGNKAIALSDDGTFAEVRNKGYKIGQSIENEGKIMKKMNGRYRNIAAGIAASMVILLGGGTAYAYNTPVAHVSLDVNPSVTYSVNSFNRVIDVDRNNPDAEAILKTIEWDGEDIEQVVQDTISALKDAKYLANEKWYEDGIIIGVNANSTAKEEQLILAIKNELAEIVAKEINKKVDAKDLDEVVVGIGAERVADAIALSEKLGFDVTPGKLNLVQKLDDSYVTLGGKHLTTSEAAVWLEGPVKDIMAQVKANKKIYKDITIEGIEIEESHKATDNNGNNGNDEFNGNNGNDEFNGNEDANKRENREMDSSENVNDNENANKNANKNGIEKENNSNAPQNRVFQGNSTL